MNIFDAVHYGNFNAFQKKLRDVNLVNEDGDSLVFLAAYYNQKEILEYLIENDVNLNPETGGQPLNEYISSRDTNNVEFLIKNGAKVDNESLITQRYDEDMNEIVKLLIINGASPNTVVNYHLNETLMHVYAENDSSEMLVFLLDHSGSLNVKNRSDETPL